MAGLPDLCVWDYSPAVAEHILAVGWLDSVIEFAKGPTAREVYERLKEFARDPWQPFVAMGVHRCNLCQFDAEAAGTANLFIPFQGKIYVSPELIVHYINSHRYSPPQVFCDAVLACPAMNSMEYKRLLLACGGGVLLKRSL